MTVRAHAAAVVGLLEAAGLTVYDADVPSAPSLPFVAVYAGSGLLVPQSLTFRSVRRDFGFQTTCVGASAKSAQWVVEHVEAALVNVTPTVEGRTCWPIRQEASQPVRRDGDLPGTTEARFYATVQWSFSSAPA